MAQDYLADEPVQIDIVQATSDEVLTAYSTLDMALQETGNVVLTQRDINIVLNYDETGQEIPLWDVAVDLVPDAINAQWTLSLSFIGEWAWKNIDKKHVNVDLALIKQGSKTFDIETLLVNDRDIPFSDYQNVTYETSVSSSMTQEMQQTQATINDIENLYYTSQEILIDDETVTFVRVVE